MSQSKETISIDRVDVVDIPDLDKCGIVTDEAFIRRYFQEGILSGDQSESIVKTSSRWFSNLVNKVLRREK